MRTLVWSPSFVRALKRKVKRQPDLRNQVEQTLRQLVDDPFIRHCIHTSSQGSYMAKETRGQGEGETGRQGE